VAGRFSPAPGETIRVDGLSQFLIALDHADRKLKREVRERLRQVGDETKKETADLIDQELKSPVSARGVKTRVRRRGVDVEQSLRKTTGLRPDWGVTQMRKGFLPGFEKTAPSIEPRLEEALHEVIGVIEAFSE